MHLDVYFMFELFIGGNYIVSLQFYEVQLSVGGLTCGCKRTIPHNVHLYMKGEILGLVDHALSILVENQN